MSLADTLDRLDGWLALSWWWKWKLQRAEDRLARALSVHGEDSFEVASGRTALRRAQFAVDYGRTAKPEIQQVIRRAEEAGMPRHGLRLMVMNVDLRTTKDGRVYVRRGWWLTALAWVSRLMVIASMAYMTAIVLSAPAAWPWKLMLLCVFMLFFGLIAYVWDLFGIRAVRANRNIGRFVEAVAQVQSTSGQEVVTPIRSPS